MIRIELAGTELQRPDVAQALASLVRAFGPAAPSAPEPPTDFAARAERALQAAGGNVARACRLAGVSRATWYRRMGAPRRVS